MKKGIKKVARTIALILTLCATGGAWATVKPLAVWCGDFVDGDKHGDFYLQRNGNIISPDGSYITIGSNSSGGVIVTNKTYTARPMTVVAAFGGLSVPTSGNDFALATSKALYNGTTVYYNRTGLSLKQSDGEYYGWWNNTVGDAEKGGIYTNTGDTFRNAEFDSSKSLHYIGYCYTSGVYGYENDTEVYYRSGLQSGSDSGVYGFSIGGLFNSKDYNATNVTVKYIAILNSNTDTDIKYWSLTDMTATEAISSSGGDITSGNRSSYGVTLQGETVNVTAPTTIAALFVQKNTELKFAKDATLTVNGPIYVANGVTLTISLADTPTSYTAGTACTKDLLIGTRFADGGTIAGGDIPSVSAGVGSLDLLSDSTKVSWVYDPVPAWSADDGWTEDPASGDSVSIVVDGDTEFSTPGVATFGTVYLQGTGTLVFDTPITATSVVVPAGVTLVADSESVNAPVLLSAATSKLQIAESGSLPGAVTGIGVVEIADGVTATTTTTFAHTGGTVLGSNAKLNAPLGSAAWGSAVTGGSSARVVMTGSGSADSSAKAGFQNASTWTGTVELGNYTLVGLRLTHFGNTSSTVCVNGTSATFETAGRTATSNAAYHNVGAWEIGSGGFSMPKSDYRVSVSNLRVLFPCALKGTGTIEFGYNAYSAAEFDYVVFTGDVSGFEGTFNAGTARSGRPPASIVFGGTGTTYPAFTDEFSTRCAGASGSIHILSGKTVTFNANSTWIAVGGYFVDGTLNLNSTLKQDASTAGVLKGGAGTIKLGSLSVENSVSGFASNASWTGQVEVPAFTAATGTNPITFNNLGNVNSTVVLKGVGHGDYNTATVYPTETGSTINPTVRIDGDVYFTDASQNNYTIFSKLTGSGNLYIDSALINRAYLWKINVLTNFTGTLASAIIPNDGIENILKIGSVALDAGEDLSTSVRVVKINSDSTWSNIVGVDETAITIGGEATAYKLIKKNIGTATAGLYIAPATVTSANSTVTPCESVAAAITLAGTDPVTITLFGDTDQSFTLYDGQRLDTRGFSIGGVTGSSATVETPSSGNVYTAIDNASNTWIGSSGANWGDASNWENGIVPNTFTAVTLPANGGTAYTIGVTSSDQCGAITVNGDVTLSRATSGWKQLHINGNVSGSGTLTLNMVGLTADSGSSIEVSCDFVADGGTDNAFVGGKSFVFKNPVQIQGSSGSYFKNESVSITFENTVTILANAQLRANGADIVFDNGFKLYNGKKITPTGGSVTISGNAISGASCSISLDDAFPTVGNAGATDVMSLENVTMSRPGGNFVVGNGGTACLTIGNGATVSVGTSSSHKWLTLLTASGNSEGNEININAGGVLEACVLTYDNNASPCPYAVNFNGGTLRTYCGTDYYKELIHDTSIGVNVLAGGAKVEVPSTYTATIKPVMASGAAEDGGLTKLGAGSLVVGSASYIPTYNGKTKVVAGALYLPTAYEPNLDITTQETDSDKDGYKKYVFVPAASFDDDPYDTVAEAIDAAEEAGGGTVKLLRNCDENVNIANRTITFDENGYSFSGTFSGSGTIVLGSALNSAKSALWPEDWTGVVELKDITTAIDDFSFNNYGNANSTVRMNNVKCNFVEGLMGEVGCIDVVNDGLIIDPDWWQNDKVKTISADITGSGTIAVCGLCNIGGGFRTYYVFAGDMSGFSGAVNYGSINASYRSAIVFKGEGDEVPTADSAGQIFVREHATVNVGAAWTGTQLIIDGTVSVASAGSLAGTIGGTGMISYATVPASALSFGTWTGTVELPSFNAGGTKFDNYGKSGSTVIVNGVTGGWLDWTAAGSPNESRHRTTLDIQGEMNITAFSDYVYILDSIKGDGAISFGSGAPRSLTITKLEKALDSDGVALTNNTSKVLTITELALPEGASVAGGAKLLTIGGSGEFSLGSVSINGSTQSGMQFNYRSNDGIYAKTVATVNGTPYALLSDALATVSPYPIMLTADIAGDVVLKPGQALVVGSYTITGSVTGEASGVTEGIVCSYDEDNKAWVCIDNRTNNWVGTQDTDWGNANNWSKGLVPGTYTAVTINSFRSGAELVSSGSITLSADTTVKSITLGENVALTLNAASETTPTLTVSEAIYLTSGQTITLGTGVTLDATLDTNEAHSRVVYNQETKTYSVQIKPGTIFSVY